MHFHGQMSTQPSHMMHSAWSMWRNCLGLTDLPSSSGLISASVYSPGNAGIGGLASVRAMRSDLLHEGTAEGRLDHLNFGLPLTTLLPRRPQGNLRAQEDDVDARDDDVTDR